MLASDYLELAWSGKTRENNQHGGVVVKSSFTLAKKFSTILTRCNASPAFTIVECGIGAVADFSHLTQRAVGSDLEEEEKGNTPFPRTSGFAFVQVCGRPQTWFKLPMQIIVRCQ